MVAAAMRIRPQNFPAAAFCCERFLELGSSRGTREVSASEFFQGPFTTAIAPDELLLAVHIPVAQPDALFSFHELSRRQGDFAMAGVAARARCSGERWDTDWVGFGVSDRPVQLSNVKALFDEIGVAHGAHDRVRAALAGDLQLDLYEEGVEIKRVWTADSLIDAATNSLIGSADEPYERSYRYHKGAGERTGGPKGRLAASERSRLY